MYLQYCPAYHHNLSLDNFCSPKRKAYAHQQSLRSLPHLHAFRPKATTHLPAISMDLPILYMPYTWIIQHVVFCDYLLLLSIMYLRFVHVVVSISYFTPFYWWVIFHYMDSPLCRYCIIWIIFIHSSPVDGHFGCFCFLPVMNTTTMNICVQILTWTNIFLFLLDIYLGVKYMCL